MLRYMTAGESHGKALTAIVEGMPAGVPLTEEYVNVQLTRRQMGYGRGGRMKIEKDTVEITAGVRGGLTTGGPICLNIQNRDWVNWSKTMSPGTDADLEDRVVTKPRPGHADLAGALKYNQKDIRNILERSSARETAARVAAGTCGRALIEQFGIHIIGHVVRVGSVAIDQLIDVDSLQDRIQNSELFCADPDAEVQMKKEIDLAKQNGDSLGGVFEIVFKGVPLGLGSHVHWDRRLDGVLAQALMSIQAVKGVEIGLGFHAAEITGSKVHDEIFFDNRNGFHRQSNNAGGLEGGITNGENLVLRAAMKPIPTLYKPLRSVDMKTKEVFEASIERSDVCAVPAALVVGEAATAIEIAKAMIVKFGGDSLSEMIRNYQAYLEYIRQV